jgi:hypothetical protein
LQIGECKGPAGLVSFFPALLIHLLGFLLFQIVIVGKKKMPDVDLVNRHPAF